MLSIPPMLVKADSGISSSSASDDSFLSADGEGAEVVSLESPPRMTRSAQPQSLFQDSFGSSKEGGSSRRRRGTSVADSGEAVASLNDERGCDGAGSNVSHGSDSQKYQAGGCGTSLTSFGFLSQLLVVFSLNRPCCHQQNSTGPAADAVGCR